MQRIFLTGLSGAGKSTIGRLVANLLGWQFFDTDELIAAQVGQPAGQVLSDVGEARFRRLESEALQMASLHEAAVIATGGGAVIAETNRRLIRERGLVVNKHRRRVALEEDSIQGVGHEIVRWRFSMSFTSVAPLQHKRSANQSDFQRGQRAKNGAKVFAALADSFPVA